MFGNNKPLSISEAILAAGFSATGGQRAMVNAECIRRQEKPEKVVKDKLVRKHLQRLEDEFKGKGQMEAKEYEREQDALWGGRYAR